MIAAKAVCLGEALKPEFKEYAHQVVLNAKALAEALKKQGFKLLTDGTDNHLMLVDLRGLDISGALHGMIVDAEASRVMAFVKGVWFDNVIACYISVLPVAVLLQ